ncbi:MAG: hypothetical protein HY676_03425 [Chloroflexi bacterium]|nr:hypothetical protein [Chloroflexota bacterium]
MGNEVSYLYTAYSQAYSCNAIGNVTGKSGLAYTYSARPHAVTAMGATSYSYDNNGNMIARGSQTLTWDAESRLAKLLESLLLVLLG